MNSYQSYLRIVQKLGGTDKNGFARCFCPTHSDEVASLDVRFKEKILIKCRANCPQSDVIGALRNMGLWGQSADPKEVEARAKKSEVLKAALSYYESVTPPEIYQWIEQKWGISEATARKQRICWAPAKGQLQALQSLGYSADQLVGVGLFNKPREGTTYYPQRLYKRVIFPTFDQSGECIYLEGRHILQAEGPGLSDDLVSNPKPGKERKYIKLSGALPLFSIPSKDNKILIIVESYACAVRVAQDTGASTVALLTNAITDQGAASRKRMRELLDLAHGHDRTYILLDNQEATQERAGELAAKIVSDGVPFVYVATPPEPGQDPCEYLQACKAEDPTNGTDGAIESLFLCVPSYLEGMIQRLKPDKSSEQERGFGPPSGALLMQQLTEIMRLITPQASFNKLYFTEKLRERKIKVGQIKRATEALQEEQKQKLIEERARVAPVEANAWRQKIQWTNSGGLKQSVLNATLILTNDPAWRDTLGWDDFLCGPVFLKQPTFAPEYATPKTYELGAPLEEEDYTHICNWLADTYSLELKEQSIALCVRSAAQQSRYHPIKDYLETVQWDGQSRIKDWLHNYLGAEQHEYVSMVGTWFMVAAVARIMQPGCKMDNLIILEGAQGKGKSSALAALFGSQWVDDTPKELGSKDGYQALRGKWLLELAELDNLIKAEASSAKAFFSSSVDRYRPPYGKQMVEFPRQCVFAGTSNEVEYLRDSTGGRRFWPVRCAETKQIQVADIAGDRDQLWAEAVQLYREGARWYPKEDREIALCEEQQRRRAMTDAWEEPIRQYLTVNPNILTVTTGYILRFVFNLEPAKWDRWSQTRVGRILNNLPGWERSGRRMEDRSRVTHYQRIPEPPQPQEQEAEDPEQFFFPYDENQPEGYSYTPQEAPGKPQEAPGKPQEAPDAAAALEAVREVQERFASVGEGIQATCKQLIEQMPLGWMLQSINAEMAQMRGPIFRDVGELAIVLATDYPMPY